MAHRRKTSVRPSGRILDMLADGKKTVLAVSLVAVMAVMWIRVLIGHKPSSAGAAPAQKQGAQTEPGRPTARIRRVELSRTPGRNDSIDKDCFDMQGRPQFRQSVAVSNTGTDTEVPIVPPNRDQEVKEVAQTLKLEAVFRKGTPSAVLSDRLVKAGDTFTVERGTSVLEFEVLRIDEDAVLVECNDIQLTLQLAQSLDVRK